MLDEIEQPSNAFAPSFLEKSQISAAEKQGAIMSFSKDIEDDRRRDFDTVDVIQKFPEDFGSPRFSLQPQSNPVMVRTTLKLVG